MRLLRFPILSICLAMLAFGMLGPAIYAGFQGNWLVCQSFLVGGGFSAFAGVAAAILLSGRERDGAARTELRALVLCWVLIPVFAAIPVWMSMPVIGPWGAWFEMTAAFTTTGGTVFGEPDKVAGAIHLWRGMVAWYGGLVTLIAAAAILAPRNLGGNEVAVNSAHSIVAGGQFGGQMGAGVTIREQKAVRLSNRLKRSIEVVVPVYAALTAVLGVLFSGFGQSGLAATVHAMSVMSTSGVSPYADGLAAQPEFGVEVAAFVFMILAATRLTYRGQGTPRRRYWHQDPELKLMALLVATATLALFLRHWLGALTIDLGDEPSEALPAIWGAAFTSLSFVTTTGFESASWHTARDWSGLANPGLILLGLCAIGGGAATTAGGIKLIRAYALMRHGYRELERIAQPNSVLATGSRLRGILSEGAFLAWAFVMLYTVAIFAALIGLTISGLPFQDSLVAAIASISNTGPAFPLISPGGFDFGRLTESQRLILAAAMILGRIETLAVISLFNTDSWHQFSTRTKNHWN